MSSPAKIFIKLQTANKLSKQVNAIATFHAHFNVTLAHIQLTTSLSVKKTFHIVVVDTSSPTLKSYVKTASTHEEEKFKITHNHCDQHF